MAVAEGAAESLALAEAVARDLDRAAQVLDRDRAVGEVDRDDAAIVASHPFPGERAVGDLDALLVAQLQRRRRLPPGEQLAVQVEDRFGFLPHGLDAAGRRVRREGEPWLHVTPPVAAGAVPRQGRAASVTSAGIDHP